MSSFQSNLRSYGAFNQHRLKLSPKKQIEWKPYNGSALLIAQASVRIERQAIVRGWRKLAGINTKLFLIVGRKARWPCSRRHLGSNSFFNSLR